jgi:ATP-dependent Clp protease, protease subunit
MRKNLIAINIQASADVMALASSDSFKVGVKASDDSVEMMIHGVIGDSWEGLDSASVANFLKDHRGKSVNVDINSPGGLAYDGVSIYNALAMHDASVNVDITGIAASAATIIAMAGDRIRIAENASFMVHRAWGVGIGNTAVMRDLADFLDKLDGQIAATYAARTGRTAAKMAAFMVGEVDGTTFNGNEAVAERFADEVIPLKKRDKAGSASASASQFTAEANSRLKAAVLARLRTIQIDGDAA